MGKDWRMTYTKELSNTYLAETYFSRSKIICHEIFGAELGRIEHLRFQRPGSVVNMIDYMINMRRLIVTGDLGDAVYCWYNHRLSLDWIAGLDLGYFHGKCQASELGTGHDNHEWDEHKALKRIVQEFREDKNLKGFREFREAEPPIYSKEEFTAWTYERHDELVEWFGEDWWDWVPSCGNSIPIRTRLHLIGLKLAFGVEIKD